MRFKSTLILLALVAFSIVNIAQSQTAAPAGDSGHKTAVAVPVIVLRGTLAKGLNSKSAAVGQTFVVKTAEGLKLSSGTEIPVGSDISGHVLQSAARASGAAESSLTLTFDALLPKGTTAPLPIRGIVQAIAGPAPVSVAPPAAGDLRSESVGGAVTGARIPDDQLHSDQPVGRSAPALNESSAGVIGIKNLILKVGPVNGVDGSMFYSADKSVKLDDGSQVMLRIALKQ